MSNPLYQDLGPAQGQQEGPANKMRAFQQFMKQNQGKNPNEMIQQLLSSGQLNQRQLNQVQQMAKRIEGPLSSLKGMFGF